jgi:pimeloyl-ACP methyl ester carboxylesterase
MAAVIGVVVAALALLGAVFVWQDRLLYFPSAATVEQIGNAALRPWPSAQDFRGLVAEPAGEVRGTAIVLHGNAGHVGHRSFYAQALTPLGVRVLLAEYPGYGPRAGEPSEHNLVADALQTLRLAHAQYGAPGSGQNGGPVLLIGESLGAAVAAAAGAQQPALVAGLLLITPWDRLENVGTLHYPWLPVKGLLRDGYDSAAQLANFDRPVVVAIAARDSIVPPRLGRSLYDALAGPKQLLLIEGAGHNDWPALVDAAWWFQAIAPALGAPR